MNYLDVLAQKNFIEDGPDLIKYGETLIKLKEIIQTNLYDGKNCNDEIHKKMKWFRKYFNRTVKKFFLGNERKTYLIK